MESANIVIVFSMITFVVFVALKLKIYGSKIIIMYIAVNNYVNIIYNYVHD